MKSLHLLLAVCIVISASAQVSKVKHVIFIGCDGMGAYAVERGDNVTLKMMMKRGAYSLKALSCLPSSSAVNWSSHLTGATPTEHGYTRWNSQKPEHPPTTVDEYGRFPTIFYALKKQKPAYTSAVVYEWSGIPYLYEKECVNNEVKGRDDDETTREAIKVIMQEKPNLLFIHLNSPDSAGHEIGFNSAVFYEKVKNVDTYIAAIVAAVKKAGLYNSTVFLISADHGGRNKEHGEDTPIERQVPWILYGKPVRKKGEIKNNIMAYNTAPTIAWLLGINSLPGWIGEPVKSPF